MKKIITVFALLTCIPSFGNYANNLYSYFWANYEQFSGNYPGAQKWYQQIVKEHPSLYVYKGYIPFLFETNNFDIIARLAPTIDTAFEHDPEIQQLIAQSMQKLGRNKEADERFIKLNNEFKSNQIIAFQTANIYLSRKEPENALTTIDNLLNSSPKKANNFIFHFLKAQIYTQMNNKEKALESVKASLAMHPHFDKGWLLLALLEEQAGRLQEAIKGYTAFLEKTDGTHQDIEQHLLQLVYKQKVAQEKTKVVMAGKPCVAQALYLFENKQYPGALNQVDACLKQKPQDPESRLLKIQILSAMNNHSQAADQLKTWMLENPNNETWFATLHLLCKGGLQSQKAIAVLEDVAHAQPKNILPLLYLADLNTRLNHADTALLYHNKALALTNDARLKTKIYFHMALLYHDQHQIELMEQALQDGYALGANFPPLLNLLAYHYASHNNKLDVAQQLITIALQKSKNNPHFLDTQALIYYKQENYEKALQLLTTIAQQEPHDSAILQTLGKTYHKLGETSKAVDTIKQALQLATNEHQKTECNNLLKEMELHQ
ncbi:MAG TPA: tetratricopeptide repeat protein [Candidatus Babeliales bacterium]|nr:tetratricopeptide repeat protein [Candidatus Babeliales bacterium]